MFSITSHHCCLNFRQMVVRYILWVFLLQFPKYEKPCRAVGQCSYTVSALVRVGVISTLLSAERLGLSFYSVSFLMCSFCVQCSGLGASFCYMLSYLVGRPVVYKYLTERAQKWSQQVKELEHKMYYKLNVYWYKHFFLWFHNVHHKLCAIEPTIVKRIFF